MNDLSKFLLARFADVEAEVRGAMHLGCVEDVSDTEETMHGAMCPTRVLAECDARRRIVAYVTGPEAPRGWDAAQMRGEVLRLLALPYADHADYWPEWRP